MDLRGSIFFHLNKVLYAIHRWSSSLISLCIAYAKGVRIGCRFHACGIPYFYRVPHSTISLGEGCTILSSYRSNNIGSMSRSRICTMTPKARITIGHHIGMSAVTITAHESITIGDDTQIGAGTVIIDADFHDIRSSDPVMRRTALGLVKPVTIGKNVFIGTQCIILKGVTIGDNAVIGAGSVVSKDVPANAVAVGNPVRITSMQQ